MAAQFEIILYADKLYRFRLACSEGRTLALSGPYGTKREALLGLYASREDAAMAHVKVLTNNVDQTRGLGPVAPSLPVRADHSGEEFCNPSRDHPASEPFQPWTWPSQDGRARTARVDARPAAVGGPRQPAEN